MKKIKMFLITIIAIIFMIPTMVNAAETTKTEYANNKISVSGTNTANSTIQIALFDNNGNAKYLTTTFSDENGKFEITLPEIEGLTDGTYIIKTGSYSGNNISSAEVEVKTTNNNEKDDTPKTGTFEYVEIAILVSTISILGISILKRK